MKEIKFEITLKEDARCIATYKLRMEMKMFAFKNIQNARTGSIFAQAILLFLQKKNS